jgi:tetratricopeptide (TPR) repeat protein
MRSILTILILGCVCAVNTAAQSQKPAEPPPDLGLTAVGRQHHAIQTKSRAAQDFFDQGITLMYGFNHEEAARAFGRAGELDPASPMPLWGIAIAAGPNYNMDVDAEREKLAFETIQKAQKLAEHAPQVEKDYVAALATRYSGSSAPDYKQLSRDFSNAMKNLSEKYPDDLDAATLYAESLMDLDPWKLWSHDGKPAKGTEEIVRVLESVLQRNPNHAGANHYYIHAVEASPHPERALVSAHRLDTLVPQAGHLVHMPAHIYIHTGDYGAAVKNNVEAVKVDKVYAQKADKQGSFYDLMYQSHNEQFLAWAAGMAGMYAEASAAGEGLAKRLMPHAKMMPMLDGFILTSLWADVRFSKWDAVFTRPEPGKELQSTHVMWRYVRVLAFAASGRNDAATEEHKQFLAEVSAIPPESSFTQFNTAKDVLGVATHVVEARLAASRGNREEAIVHFRRAVEVQDTLNYDEPPDWYFPVRESLGAALLSAGKAQEAEQVFRDDLRQNPRNPRSLFGLMHSLKAQQREVDAAWVEREFIEAWKAADTKLNLSDL